MKIAAVFCMLLGSSLALSTVEILQADSRFSTLVKLVVEAGLVDTLNGGSYTVFAPTNAAFQKIAADDLKALEADTDQLKKVLLYHVAAGAVPSTAAMNEFVLRTANGAGARFNIYDHKNKTTITLQGAEVIETDKVADNGVIHVLDTVLMPPTGSIVDYVAGNTNLTTLLSLVQKAGLVDKLKEDKLTLFAPTNAAFANLSPDQLSAVQNDPALLASILTYHVVGSTQYSQGLWNREHLVSLDQGAQLVVHFRHHGDIIRINNGRVIVADIGTTNGVVHVINHVLMPPSSAGTGIVG